MDEEIVCRNRRASYDYHILDTIEAGIVLVGHEVKSLREHHVTLDSSYASVQDGEIFLLDCTIDAYKQTSKFSHIEPNRKRKLLLHKHEISKFGEKALEQGNTIVPLKIYFKNGKAKVELAVCKGKKQHDKRQSIKEKEDKRRIRKNV